jgi:membrane protease YdiL (CAAX protease family)
MATPLVGVTVRSNWREIDRERAVQRLKHWRAAVAAVVVLALVLLGGALLFSDAPWLAPAQIVLMTGVLWLWPIWSIVRAPGFAGITAVRLGAVALVLLVAVAIALALAPGGTGSQLEGVGLAMLAVPGLTWTCLFLLHRRYPISTRILGLTRDRWVVNVVIGVAAGVVLGLHLVLTTLAVPGVRPQTPPSPGVMIWVLLFRAGVMALGEELFFRGWCYQLLTGGSSQSFALATTKLVAISAPVVVWPFLGGGLEAPAGVALALAYGVAVGVVATLLRHRQQSLVPGLACNVVFGLFLVALVTP